METTMESSDVKDDMMCEQGAQAKNFLESLLLLTAVASDVALKNMKDVVQRVDDDIFPYVAPGDYNDDVLKDVGYHLENYQGQSDYVGLKTSLEEKEADFMRTTSFDDNVIMLSLIHI